ncbi:MAG: PAS domain S-box protein [Ginsengibacter sp.]
MNPLIQPSENVFFEKQKKPSFNTFGESERGNFASASEIYNAIFKNAFHAMYIALANESIIQFNKKLYKMFSYSEEEMNTLKSDHLFDMEEVAYIDFLKKREEKGIAKAEITAIKKSGIRFPCRITSVAYESESGKKVSMNTVIDISDSLSARWNIS